MRLVDLQVGADRSIHLELHPRLTVVVAGVAVQDRIASLLSRAYALAGTDVTGTVDGGGYLTTFDPTAVVALALVGDGLRVLTSRELPPPDPAPRAAARRAAVEEVDARRRRLDDAVGPRDQLRRLHDATVAAGAAGAEELTEAAARRDDVWTALAGLADRPAGLAVERADAAQAADAAAIRLEGLRSVRAELGEVLGDTEDGDQLRAGDDTALAIQLVERAAELGGLRPDEQAEAVAWLAHVTAGTAPVRASAGELMAEVEAVETAWVEAARLGTEGSEEVVAATTRRAALAEHHELLDGLSRSGVLGDTAKSQIDAAHGATQRAGRSEVDAAAAHEQEVLARYGFDSHLEFTIATSTRSVSQAVEAKLAELAAALADADAALDAARTVAAERLETLAARREPAQERVTAYLGYRPEGSSLDHLARIPEVPHVVGRLVITLDESIEAAVDEVQRYRDAVVELDDEEASLVTRRGELDEQLRQLDGRISDLDGALARVGPEADALAERLAVSDADVRELAASVAEATGAVEEIDRSPTDAYGPGDLGPVVDAVLERMDPWSANPLPVVLRDTFAPLDTAAADALAALLARAERSQVLYLTADPAVRDWARALEPADGRTIVVSQGRWSPRRLGRRVLRRDAG